MRRLGPVLAVPLVGALAGAAALLPVSPAEAAARRPITYTQWDTGAELRAGVAHGVRVAHGKLVLDGSAKRKGHGAKAHDVGTWTSPWTSPRHGFTQLVSSWSARTPGDSWIEIRVRGRSANGKRSSWDVLGRWTAGDGHRRRTSVPGQSDRSARVDVDTWKTASSAGLESYRLRVRLMRSAGARSAKPTVDTLGAMSSRLPTGTPPTSRPGRGRGVVLDVPRYSQMAHVGDYRKWGGGGEAWCSPTSTSMVLGYYDSLPRPRAWSWVGSGHTDPWVDLAARKTYDAAYRGTGNWPFNTAYAASRAGHGFVTRLRSLREAERFIAAGIPLVASISFGRGGLDGAPISSTAGHLLVIAGFTRSGDVVVNDPAARTRGGVRRTYDRGQFERAWLPTSGGLAYVITDDAHPLPGGHHSNW